MRLKLKHANNFEKDTQRFYLAGWQPVMLTLFSLFGGGVSTIYYFGEKMNQHGIRLDVSRDIRFHVLFEELTIIILNGPPAWYRKNCVSSILMGSIMFSGGRRAEHKSQDKRFVTNSPVEISNS
jgi:hypothetical protein